MPDCSIPACILCIKNGRLLYCRLYFMDIRTAIAVQYE